MMNSVRLVVALAAVVAGAPNVLAADGSSAAAEPSGPLGFALVSSLDAREETLAAAASTRTVGARPHDPGRMFLLSLAVPGTGQLVQGQRRGYLYLMVELGLWYGFYALDRKGRTGRDEYEAYANTHWDYNAYMEWYSVACPETATGYECRPLAKRWTQEYYEDIGKYDTYWRWWHMDGDEGEVEWRVSDADEAARNAFWAMRGESNRDLRHARYSMMAAFLNHVVASVDAFLSARGPGEERVGETDLGLEFGVPTSGDGLSCAFVARY